MAKKRFAVIGFALFAGSALAQAPQLPSNFTTTTGTYDAQYVDMAKFEYSAPAADDFKDKAARCGISNLSVDSFVAKDASQSWIGPATGRLYNDGTNTVFEGSDVLRYVSDTQDVVILKGREKFGKNKMGLIGLVSDPSGESFKSQLDFIVELAKSGDVYSITFSEIKRADQSTGYIENSGFSPIGVWKGSRAEEIVPVIESVAEKLNACMQS